MDIPYEDLFVMQPAGLRMIASGFYLDLAGDGEDEEEEEYDDEDKYREFLTVLIMRFRHYIKGFSKNPNEFKSADEVFQPHIDGHGHEKELQDIMGGFEYVLHGVISMACSLSTVEFVYNLNPLAIEDYAYGGFLPIHIALMNVKVRSGFSLQWDVIRFLIDKYPAALSRRERASSPSQGMLPLHTLLDVYHTQSDGDTMYKEHLDLFIRPGYEYTMLEGYRYMYDYRQGPDAPLPTYSPYGIKRGYRFAFYFVKKQVEYAARFLGTGPIARFVHWFVVCLMREPFQMEDETVEMLCDIFLCRVNWFKKQCVLALALHYCHLLEDEGFPKKMELCMDRFCTMSTPVSAIADDFGNTTLHSMPREASAYTIVPWLLQGFPKILEYRNKKGETPFQAVCFADDRDGKLDFLYTLLRSDPSGTLNESFVPMEQLHQKLPWKRLNLHKAVPLQDLSTNNEKSPSSKHGSPGRLRGRR